MGRIRKRGGIRRNWYVFVNTSQRNKPLGKVISLDHR
jgi:hypothetical protein